MFKVLSADKDAYITDKVIAGNRASAANTGDAGSLNLFKLYGLTTTSGSANIELSRLLIHFDLADLRLAVAQGKVDVGHPSFEARLRLFDVDGGDTLPTKFTVTVHPLSRSFDEGLGRDVVEYSDRDVCNFLSGSSAQGAWILSGANMGGSATGSVDYIMTAPLDGTVRSLERTQYFKAGDEDLSVNVTQVVSGILSSQLPDEGFRIALTSSLEVDSKSYFVKRFASRTAYSPDYRPRLEVRFDDSVQDDSQNLTLDDPCCIFLYNFSQGSARPILSGTTPILGQNSLKLRLEMPVSGGTYSLAFNAGQHRSGINAVTGAYSASVTVPSSAPQVIARLAASGSAQFTPIWGSLDGTVGYLTGSAIAFRPSQRGGRIFEPRSLTINVRGLSDTVRQGSVHLLRVDVFDRLAPHQVAGRFPYDPGGDVVRDLHYQVRDQANNHIAVPFDTVLKSTRVSSDSRGMFFNLDTSALADGRSYVIDILADSNGVQREFPAASQVFRVNELP